METVKVNLRLTQLYLETARSIFTGIHRTKEDKLGEMSNEELDRLSNILFAMASMSVIYSYLAVESFANYHLYKIWTQGKRAQKAFEDIGRKDPKLLVGLRPTYGDFFKKYGHVGKFEDLKTTRLRDLDKRLTEICTAYAIIPIHRKNTRLWQEFKGFLKLTRNFLVHPLPDPAKFNEVSRTLLYEKPSGAYVEIAKQVIGHYYVELKQRTPDWLQQNELFTLRGVNWLSK